MGEGAPIHKVGVIAHGGREEALAAAKSLIGWLHERGVATRWLAGERVGAGEEVEDPRFGEGLDLVLSVGGDGTLLRAAHIASGAGVPLLGVKVGRLGFLTEVEPSQAPALLSRILGGDMVTDDRMALEARPRNSGP